MQWVASQNIASADSLLLRPTTNATSFLKTLGRVDVAPLAHYLAEEQNRSLFETWGVIQIVASVLFFFFLLFGTRVGKVPVILGLLLVALAIVERAVVIPEMKMVGRAADFVVDPSRRVKLAGTALNFGYTAAELAKWLLAAGIAAYLLFEQGRRSSRSRHQVDVVDKTDYRHVDR
jgi:hypothetical protein